MKSKFFTASLLVSALFAALGVAPTTAQGGNTNTNRIDEVVRSGHITQPEASFKRDGVLTQQEARGLAPNVPLVC